MFKFTLYVLQGNIWLLPIAYKVRREGHVLSPVCLSRERGGGGGCMIY